jgi:hypothetical protein
LTCEIDPRSGTDRTVTLLLAPQLPAGSLVTAVQVDGAAHPYEVSTLATGVVVVRLELAGPLQSRRIRILHGGGIDLMPVDEPLEPGDASRNLRIVRVGLEGDLWRMMVEGRPERDYRIDFFTDRKLVATRNDMVQVVGSLRPGVRIRLRAPKGLKPTASGFVRWNVNFSWQ